MARDGNDNEHDSLLNALMRLTGQVAGGTFELACNTAISSPHPASNALRTSSQRHSRPSRQTATTSKCA